MHKHEEKNLPSREAETGAEAPAYSDSPKLSMQLGVGAKGAGIAKESFLLALGLTILS